MTTATKSSTMRFPAWASAVVSAFVVLLGLLYVVAPTEAGVDFGVDEIAADTPYDEIATVSYSPEAARAAQQRPRYRERFYGVVRNPARIPVSNARVVVQGVSKGLRHRRVWFRIPSSNRTYRATVHLKPGRYRVSVILRAAGKKRTVSKQIRVRNHRTYRAAVTIRERGITTMLPISSY